MSIQPTTFTEDQSGAVCPSCGSSDIGMARVRSAFFHDDRLVVIEEIPALVCASCNDQFYDDRTVVALDLLRGEGFPSENARSEIRVPVFSFPNAVAVEADE
ncbi:MAG: YgiT-type zinc finger protein [Afipia sp.]|nr:YgiT-type zinc finger protein [Afipia sp.]